MSAKGQAFVEAHSPYTGATYLVHLRLGMLENETYGHRLFIGEEKLAGLCRCDRKTVQRARRQMVDDGFLVQTSPAKRNSPAEYEFLFPELAGQNVSPMPEEMAGHLIPDSETSGPESENSPITRIKENLTTAKSFQVVAESIYESYPKKRDRVDALRAITTELKKGTSSGDLLLAMNRYVTSHGDDEVRFLKNCATFFRSDRWREWLTNPISASIDDHAETVRRLADDSDWQAELERRHAESTPAPKGFADSIRSMKRET